MSTFYEFLPARRCIFLSRYAPPNPQCCNLRIGLGLGTPKQFRLNWFGLGKAKLITPKPNCCRYLLRNLDEPNAYNGGMIPILALGLSLKK